LKIDADLIEALLYEEEGVELDVKKGQYAFKNASEDEKSELLKDILAFANAWRRSDAFILIGVEEVKGGRNTIVGISELLDDAPLQQFVNYKTNRPIEFSYRNLQFEEKTIGVIHVAVQQRPVYLNRDYGKLKKETVYLRRGSSTAIAGIDEISKMGAGLKTSAAAPELKIHFADPDDCVCLPDLLEVESLVLTVPPKKDIPDLVESGREMFGVQMYSTNRDYYRELVDYTRVANLVTPIYLAIENSGSGIATDVRVQIRLSDVAGSAFAIDTYDYPEVPEARSSYLFSTARSYPIEFPSDEVTVQSVRDAWLIEARADKVQAKATYWFHDPLYIGNTVSGELQLELTTFSDQLSDPVEQILTIGVSTTEKIVDLDGIKALEAKRFRESPEFRRIMDSENDE